MKRLGLLIIGDEILAGHTQDANTHWLARRLATLGVTLARVEVCSDDLDDIESSMRRFLHDLDFDYAITSGGLGPTHDDRTMEGLARAIDAPLTMDPQHRDWMAARVAEGHRRGYFASSEPNAGHLKMALLPAGAEALPNELGTCLGAVVRAGHTTLYTLPGVPREFERMFDESVVPRLEQGAAKHVEELIVRSEESRFFEVFRDAETAHGVSIGSYPQPGHLIVRASGDKAAAKAAIADIRAAVGPLAD